MYSKQELHNILNKLFEENGNKYITIEQMCKTLKTSQKTLHNNFLQVDGYENCPDVFLHIKRPIKQFETLNEESAYWIGYLMADGCIALKQPKNKNQKTTSRLMLECKIDDKEIIEKFCDFLDIRKSRITIGHNGMSAALSLSTQNFTTDLSIYGLVPNKSHQESVLPIEIKENKDLLFQYLKGLVDGDGTIHTAYGSPGVSVLSNSKTLLEELKYELEKYLPEPNSIWLMEKTKEQQKGKNASQSLFILKIGTGMYKHSNIVYLYKAFYEDKKIILTRKEQLLKSLIIN